jgi:hypothetical protein
MPILKRIISEFWLAFVVALVWAVLRAWPFRAEWPWAGTFVANFGAAFFLVSYFTGQYVRIKRQHTNEQTFATFGDQLGGLTSAVSGLTAKVADVVAREPNRPDAKDLLNLASIANTQMAQANSTAAAIRNSMPWQADTPLPLRVPLNPAAFEPASTWVPKPPDKPSATRPT